MPEGRKPIFRKVSNLLKVPILRRPIMPKLRFLMKSRNVNRFKLLKYHNYGFLHEYQFSAPNTPLIQYSRTRRSIKNSVFRRFCRILFLSQCVGLLKGESVLETNSSWIETLPNAIEVACPARDVTEPFDYLNEDEYGGDSSIDQRAERFIERFYEEMRMQRRESA